MHLAIGQLLRRTRAKDIYTKNSKLFKKTQEIILLSIVWNAFCNAFSGGLGLEFRHGLTLLFLLPTLHLGALFVLQKVFQGWNERRDVIAAMFVASQKTLAFGLPLINTIFEGSPHLASYCAPLMIIHPLQLALGSFLVPRLSKYVEGE